MCCGSTKKLNDINFPSTSSSMFRYVITLIWIVCRLILICLSFLLIIFNSIIFTSVGKSATENDFFFYLLKYIDCRSMVTLILRRTINFIFYWQFKDLPYFKWLVMTLWWVLLLVMKNMKNKQNSTQSKRLYNFVVQWSSFPKT